jgi:hypothetical protein
MAKESDRHIGRRENVWFPLDEPHKEQCNMNSNNNAEQDVLVSLDAQTKGALEARAKANGRATKREAAQVIKEAVGTAPKPQSEGGV